MSDGIPALATLLALSLDLGAACVDLRVQRVYDGDTPYVHARMWLFGDRAGVAVRNRAGASVWGVRVRGYDTPEIRGGCPESKRLARQARDYLAERIAANGGVVTLCNVEMHYQSGDRPVADLYLAGESVAQIMVKQGLARPYDGESKRKGWCDGP